MKENEERNEQEEPEEDAADQCEAVVEEHALTAPSGAALGRVQARTLGGERATVLTSSPEVVSGYGAVGVTWEPGTELLERQPRTEEEMQSSLWMMP